MFNYNNAYLQYSYLRINFPQFIQKKSNQMTFFHSNETNSYSICEWQGSKPQKFKGGRKHNNHPLDQLDNLLLSSQQSNQKLLGPNKRRFDQKVTLGTDEPPRPTIRPNIDRTSSSIVFDCENVPKLIILFMQIDQSTTKSRIKQNKQYFISGQKNWALKIKETVEWRASNRNISKFLHRTNWGKIEDNRKSMIQLLLMKLQNKQLYYLNLMFQKQNIADKKMRLEKRKKFNQMEQEMRQQIQKQNQKIDGLLSRIEQMRCIRNILKKCDALSGKNDQQKCKALLYRYDRKYDYQAEFQPYEVDPYVLSKPGEFVCLEVQSRCNWIQKYLDQSDIVIYGKFAGNKVKIVRENNGIVYFVNADRNKFGHGNQAGHGQQINKRLQDFYVQNKSITISFVKNKFKYQFGESIVRILVSEDQQHDKNRILIEATSQSQQIRRVLILKLKTISTQQDGSKVQEYRMHEGFCQVNNFIQSSSFSSGEQYLLIPFPGTSLALYTSTTSLLQFDIVQSQNRCQIKQMNLLLQGFPQCHLQNINAEFTRDCDFDAGIVIEVYRNIYNNQIFFEDAEKNNKEKQQDKKLMFESLYSKRYRSYRLKRGETVVEFYGVTKKPWVLYQPKKRVIIDKNEDYEAQTVHSILK